MYVDRYFESLPKEIRIRPEWMKSGVSLRPMQENLETVAARTGRYLLFALAGGSLMEISRLFCELYWPLSDDGWRLGPVELTCHSYFL